MKQLNLKNVKIKNLIGIIPEPKHEDLLFEIVKFLYDENRMDGVFTLRETSLKTRIRISKELSEDLDELKKLGYITKLNNSKFEVMHHIWE